MKFVQARNYTRASRGIGDIGLLVIHTMESPEKPTTAEDVAAWFAGPNAPQASAHYCIDSNSVVQCVRDKDVAWAAPGANRNGLHFEHAGRASQGTAGWHDAYSQAMLRRSAELVADKAVYYAIPVRRVTAAQIRNGTRGICGHWDVTRAYPDKGSHTDPGKDFPWGEYLEQVKDFAARARSRAGMG